MVTGAINTAAGNPANSMYVVVVPYLLAGAILVAAIKAARDGR